MGQYKVPQNVEAEDKILGPLTFKQFIYALMGFGWAADHFGETPALIAVGLVLFSSAIVLFFVSRTGRARRLIAQTELTHRG